MSDAPQPPNLDVGLDDLIRVVRVAQPDDELARLRTAVQLSERLDELGDHLVGHFVDEARGSGASWRAIGESMGVTKQAAQQRFVPSVGELPEEGFLSRFTPRARQVLTVARE